MAIIVYIVLGGIVGWLASLIMGRKEGIIADIVIGIVGAIIGSFLVEAFGGPGVTGFNISSFLVALAGAIILLFVIGLFRHGGTRRHTA